MSVSVLTIVRGRQSHLENLLAGLSQSHSSPNQWIVVGMDQDVDLPDPMGLDIRHSRINGDGNRLPLAEARNHAAELCRSERMIFLDVDCIPSPDMIETFDTALSEDPRLWMGSPRYLPAGATDDTWTLDEIASVAVPHPLQPDLAHHQREPSTRYEMFWSLCFGITKTDFATMGGFDPSFDGYGGEDTDFAFSARRSGIPFGFVGALAFHQHHPVCKPPLNHFHEIISNAKRFRAKWGEWPMSSWLESFQTFGLVSFDPSQDRLEALRDPSEKEIEQATTLAPAGF
ncbi:galactosyltransferase-related protein [Rubripirellula amarantea]|uniref:Glycosyl transferase family 2 n=1 Tax=Rubripirellula amarantea TaxID=2527999 RepID=A0A5C5WX53_9BACT|nr:galactosyltransferase-related protein [Rubripirellula amarantea]MDA8745784.1 galactosyltransferase-related protein [Rubripirellula amarantea]TWT54829.1 Glycosyl transferase family 2 [Rubripirellula amarantea]